jgi:hypothetical protein
MSRSVVLLISTIAAGAMGWGVAQAARTTRQAPAAAQTLFATCDGQGKMLVTRSRATSCARTGVGAYVVAFDRSVVGCAFMATLGRPRVQTFPGYTSVSEKQGNANAVVVATGYEGRTHQDHSFYVLVQCAR